MGGRPVIRITPSDVGKRISVRSLTGSGRPGEKFMDTVGVLTSWDGGVLCLIRRSGEPVRIEEARLVAGKVVPAAPARRRGLPAASVAELSRVAARAWPPATTEQLGAWVLRATGRRGTGFTRRANSVLPAGDPGMPLDAALDQVVAWYAARDRPAIIQLTTGAEGTDERLAAELDRRGWSPEAASEVWIASLAPVADTLAGTGRVTLSRAPDEAWLSRCHRFSDRAPDAEELAVLTGGPSVWFAAVPGDGTAGAPGGAPDTPGLTDPGTPGVPRTPAAAAIGRCAVDGRWAGYTAVEVDPEHRRQGLATAVVTALAQRALTEGASAAYLEVETDNAEARALYRRLGFARHHSYHHWRAPAG